MKVDAFNAIVFSYVAMFLILSLIDASRWLEREYRSGGLRRRLHRWGIKVGPAPEPEIEVSLSKPVLGARRSLKRHTELRRRLLSGWGHWGPIQHRDP